MDYEYRCGCRTTPRLMRTAARSNTAHRAKLPAQLIRNAQVPAGIELIVLGDTAFDAKCVRAACDERGYFWIVPVNANRVFSAKKNGTPPRQDEVNSDVSRPQRGKRGPQCGHGHARLLLK